MWCSTTIAGTNSSKTLFVFSAVTIIVFLNYLLFLPHYQLYFRSDYASKRIVIATLIRSTNKSVFLTINMIHSVIQFCRTDGISYPFIIFHDENFTSLMREQILSCVTNNTPNVNISFVPVNLKTTVQPASGSRLQKPIGYRMMCRFWTYDVFYHPAIIQGNYDYLMRMDDDSYFSNSVPINFIKYMNDRNLDYIYRATYDESYHPMHSILRRYNNRETLRLSCIYNNFFIIRLKWFYGSKRVQSFIEELVKDDLMLREYIGDGCIHSAMLEIDSKVRSKRVVNIPYGHNFHLMPLRQWDFIFKFVPGFNEEMNKTCHQLTVLRSSDATVTRIFLR